MALRITLWLSVFLICTPMVLAAWYPDSFTIALRFVLRYGLEFALPIFTHIYGLWVAYAVRTRVLGRLVFLICCGLSIGSFAYLYQTFTALAFYIVTAVPALYAISSNLLSGKVRFSGRRA
jgi:hypothetical protein